MWVDNDVKMSAIFKMATKTRHKKWVVKIQHCPMSSVEFMRYCGDHFENGEL
jgi:hypothetical protein